MSLSIVIGGKELSQEQLDAIAPVVNKNMQRPMGIKKFEAACLEAMKNAGCPLAQPTIDERIAALESREGSVLPNTTLVHTFIDGTEGEARQLGWVLGIGGLQHSKTVFYGPTIDDALRAAEQALIVVR